MHIFKQPGDIYIYIQIIWDYGSNLLTLLMNIFLVCTSFLASPQAQKVEVDVTRRVHFQEESTDLRTTKINAIYL